MDKYTPEPWKVGEGRTGSLMTWPGSVIGQHESGDSMVIASCNQNFIELAFENAKRIVACVNALEGIPTEELEGWPGTMGQKAMMDAKTIASLTAERDRLREALNEVLLIKGTWDGEVASLYEKKVNHIARKALAESGR
jgi:hypothetical protein